MEEKLMVNEFEEATANVVKSSGKTKWVIGGVAIAAGIAGLICKKMMNRKTMVEVEPGYDDVNDDSEEESEE